MNIQNIHNNQSYTPNFNSIKRNNDYIELLTAAFESTGFPKTIIGRSQKLEKEYPAVDFEFLKYETHEGMPIPVIKNLNNGNTISGFHLRKNMQKSGLNGFLDMTALLFAKLNQKFSKETFDLLEAGGPDAAKKTKKVLAQLKIPKAAAIQARYIADDNCKKLLDKFINNIKAKSHKNEFLVQHGENHGYMKVNSKQTSFVFTFLNNAKEETGKSFKIVPKPDGYTFKENISIDKDEIIDTLNEFIPKYFKLINKPLDLNV